MFFRIERTGRPAAVRPVSIPLSVLCPHPPHFPAHLADGQTRVRLSLLYNPRRLAIVSLLRDHRSIQSDLRGIPARAGPRPDASPRDTLTRATLPAAPPQALRATTQTAGRFLSRAVFSPSGWNGECIAASAARRPGDPATDPHSGTRDSLPSHGRFRGQRLRRERLRRHQCPARFFGSPAECAFPSPPFRFCSSVFSALPAACQID